MNAYEQKLEARRERLEARSHKLHRLAEAIFAQSRARASVIPFGQPILIGHHSEGRDRNYRARIARGFRKSFELAALAKEIDSRIAGVGSGGISSDDPEAEGKILHRIAKLEADQTMMKGANVAIRKSDDDGLVRLGFSDEQIAKLKLPDFAGRVGFPGYALTNNNANIRRLRIRLGVLAAKPTQTSEQLIGEVRMVQDADDNRVVLYFPGKPADSVRKELRASGFKWSPTRGAWVRQLNGTAVNCAEYILRRLADRSNQDAGAAK